MSDAANNRISLYGVPADIGTCVGTKSGGFITVTINGVDVVCNAPRDITFAAGDVVLVQRKGSQWFVVHRYGTAAPAVPENIPVPEPKPSVTYGTLTTSPVETRSYRNSSWRTDNADVYHGQYGGNGNHRGCVFYGSKPSSLEGATALSAYIKVRRQGGGAYAKQSTTMYLMTNKTRPSGAPTLTSSVSGPRLAVNTTDSSFTIPTSWAQSMIDGTAGGLAFYDSSGSPYVVFSGKGSWSPAFTLVIKWRR